MSDQTNGQGLAGTRRALFQVSENLLAVQQNQVNLEAVVGDLMDTVRILSDEVKSLRQQVNGQ